MQNTSPYENLDDAYEALKKVVENPTFLKEVAEIRDLPPLELLQAAFTRLTPQALANRGITIPKGFAIITSASQHSVLPTTNIGAYRPELKVESTACIPLPPWLGGGHVETTVPLLRPSSHTDTSSY